MDTATTSPAELPSVAPVLVPPVVAQAQRWKTYVYTGAALGITAGVAAIGAATFAVGVASSPAVLLAAALVGPAMLLLPIHRMQHKPVLQAAALLTFSCLAGVALSIMGAVGPAVLVPAALITGAIGGAMAYLARHARQISPDHGVGMVNVGVFWGMTVGGTAGACLTGGLAAAVIRVAAGLLGMAATASMILGHCSQVQVEAHESDYDPLCHALRLYIDLIFLFGGVGRGLRPAT